MCKQRPDRARVLVGQRDGRNVRMTAVEQAGDPDVGVDRLALRRQDRRACSVDQQGSQVHVAALESVEVRTPVGPLKFQPGGRQALVPLFLGPYEKMDPPRYSAQYAQRVEAAFPASKSLPQTAAEAGCKLN